MGLGNDNLLRTQSVRKEKGSATVTEIREYELDDNVASATAKVFASRASTTNAVVPQNYVPGANTNVKETSASAGAVVSHPKSSGAVPKNQK